MSFWKIVSFSLSFSLSYVAIFFIKDIWYQPAQVAIDDRKPVTDVNIQCVRKKIIPSRLISKAQNR